jgi:hypothetical protein
VGGEVAGPVGSAVVAGVDRTVGTAVVGEAAVAVVTGDARGEEALTRGVEEDRVELGDVSAGSVVGSNTTMSESVVTGSVVRGISVSNGGVTMSGGNVTEDVVAVVDA